MDGSGGQLRHGGARAGMTLVELLIALALMVAVAGLALPNMFAILGRSTAEEGRRQSLGALAGARAEAIGAGEPVRVMAEPAEGAGGARGGGGGGWRLRARAIAPDGGELASAGPEAEGWAPESAAVLPAGWIVLAAPEAGATGATGGDAAPVEAVEPVELVIFLPDGGALAPAEGVQFAAGERRFSLTFDRWSGRAALTAERTGEAEEEAGNEAGREGDAGAESEEWGEEDPQW